MLRRSSCIHTFSGEEHLLRCRNWKWRDWANLPSDLTEQITSWLLRYDVTEYLRFRAVCKALRMCTDAPRGMEIRFRTRQWIMLSNCDGARRRFLNLVTGACAHVDLPELSGHQVEGSTEGFLVLRDKGSYAIRLLNPFTRFLVELPSIAAALKSVYPLWSEKWGKPIPSGIVEACISDETSPPSVALFLKGQLWNIAYAKPGDEIWSLVDEKSWELIPEDRRLLSRIDSRRLKCVWHISAMTLRGRIYYATYEGNILMLCLHPRPRMVPLIGDQTGPLHCPNVVSYLVPADESVFMVRFRRNLCHLEPHEQRLIKRRKNMDLIKLPSETRSGWFDWHQLQVFEVDLWGKRLVPTDNIGSRAIFVGDVACVSLCSRRFRSVHPNAVYLGTNSRCSIPCGVCHLKDGRIEPPLDLVLESGGKAPVAFTMVPHRERILPHARPCSLEEYLVCYVGIKGGIKD